MVSSLGSEIRSVVKVVAVAEEQRTRDDKKKSGLTQKETGKAALRSVSFADLEEDDKEIKDNDNNNNNDDGNNDDDFDAATTPLIRSKEIA